MTHYYKWLANDGPVYGKGTYDLTGGWQPRIKGKLVSCKCGYHVLTAEQVAYWRGDGLIEVEPQDIETTTPDKCVCRTWRFMRRLRWTRQDMLDCANADAKSSQTCVAANWAAAAANCAADVRYAAFAADAAAYAAAAAADAAAYAAAARYAADAAAADTTADERTRQRAWIGERIGEKLI